MSLVELMVSVLVTAIVLGSATAAYLKLMKSYKTQSRMSEGYMATTTGLEMLRYDLQMAGFGMPTNAVTYADPLEATDATMLNETNSTVTRPLSQVNNTGTGNSDMLAVRSTTADPATGGKWSIVYYNAAAWIKPGLTTGDSYIVMDSSKNLQTTSCGGTAPLWLCNDSGGTRAFSSTLTTATFLAYGVGTATSMRRAYNRADYYLGGGTLPSRCYAGSSILYRSLISQTTGGAGGTRIAQPLLDCVLDFQVVFGVDAAGTGVLTWSADTSGAWASSKANMSTQLKEVRVYLTYQDGSIDTSYNSGATLSYNDPGALLGSVAIPADARNFRWQTAVVAVKPMNL